jgi:CBS domain-containing protein
MDDASSRFLHAFAAVENHLRKLLRAANHVTFYDLVEKASAKDAAVRRSRYALRELGDLRNFLVHNYDRTDPLAIPSDRAVDRIQVIRDELLSPPRLHPGFAKEVATCRPEDPVGTAAAKMHKGAFSQLPVYRGTKLVDLLTAVTVARWVAARLADGLGMFEEEPVATVLKHQEAGRDFQVMGHRDTVFDALQAFEQGYHAGRLLDAIILTPNGSKNEMPTGIVTVADMPELQEHVRV